MFYRVVGGVCLFFCLCSNVFAQEEPIDSTLFKGKSPYEYILLDTTPEPEKLVYKPILGIGRGFFMFLGDVRDNYYAHPTIGRGAWNFSVSRTLNKYFDIRFNIIYGKMAGNTQTQQQFYNFQTEALLGNVLIQYNFRHLIKKTGYLLPTISLGFESFEFNSKADMYDAQGRYYYYWSDGTIRNKPETVGNELNTILLQRDYVYETDLRELNLDGLGKYPQVAIAFPVDFALEYRFSHRVKAKVGCSYHFTLNNNIDNVSDKSQGNRKGTKKGDSFLFTYFTLTYDLFSPPKLTAIEQHLSDVDFATLDKEDEDGDGVIDIWDECIGTPLGVKVDSKGCPVDKDNDGVPDYRDDEPESKKGAIVNLRGVTYTEEELIAAAEAPRAVPTNQLCEYFPSMCPEQSKVKKFKKSFAEMPAKFKPVDLNNDGYISIEEINIAIDKFFDMKTNLTIEDIYELNDYFFDQ
ncbi:MAG: hypothetical protein N2449_09720 [Bacteroidales bacterium]|nr:hypothetical protein [Bacteroidales bacterium]